MTEEDILMVSHNESKTVPPKKGFFWLLSLGIVSLFLSASIYTYFYLSTPPAHFPIEKPITIELGTSLREAVTIAAECGLVRSKWLLYIELLRHHKETPVMASTYVFERPLTVNEVATRLTKGDYNTTLIKLTIPEGSSVADIAEIAKVSLKNFDSETFLTLAAKKEGYLFPETYHIPATYTANELYILLSSTFDDKIKSLEPAISTYSMTLPEIVILASIIEREANTEDSMKIVSGILQERLRIGIALQVDASMEYVLDKPLQDLTSDDLKQKSPYNTYLNTGLPPTAISNPGLQSIIAVLNPTLSDYLFYITGTDGTFYYARTFEEHKQNIARYLR